MVNDRLIKIINNKSLKRIIIIINNPQKVKFMIFFREKLINEFFPNYIDLINFKLQSLKI